MQYSVATFSYHFAEEWQQEIFEQNLCDIGFDCFDGEQAYIPTSSLDENKLRELLSNTHGAELLSIELCPDENWNATWEEEHGEQIIPIRVNGFTEEVVIHPHCAFGAGYHETTSMLVDAIEAEGDLSHKMVLDNGCGTGVLGIVAAKLGATVVALDIDEKSVENTQENALSNRVKIDVILGDTPIAGEYDLILSNIHRNILAAQMPLYARYLKPQGEVWMSGFFPTDSPTLIAEAQKVGLTLVQQSQRGDWCMLKIKKLSQTL